MRNVSVRHHLRRTRTSGVVPVVRHSRNVEGKDRSEIQAMNKVRSSWSETENGKEVFAKKNCHVCGKEYTNNNNKEYNVCSANCQEKAVEREKERHTNETQSTDDLTLKDLDQYSGTEQYHAVMGANVTDGVAYIMKNGYSWYVTDFLAIARSDKKLKGQEFLAVELKANVGNGKPEMVVTDGNMNVLYTQKYSFTSAKRNPKMFYKDGVLMLAGEY